MAGCWGSKPCCIANYSFFSGTSLGEPNNNKSSPTAVGGIAKAEYYLILNLLMTYKRLIVKVHNRKRTSCVINRNDTAGLEGLTHFTDHRHKMNSFKKSSFVAEANTLENLYTLIYCTATAVVRIMRLKTNSVGTDHRIPPLENRLKWKIDALQRDVGKLQSVFNRRVRTRRLERRLGK